MNRFNSNARDDETEWYRRAGSRAVSLEVMEIWDAAADAWCQAARMAPRADWQQFAQQRARTCLHRSQSSRKGRNVLY